MLSSVLPETVGVPLLIIYYCRLIPTVAIGARYAWGGNLSPPTLVLWLLGSHVGGHTDPLNVIFEILESVDPYQVFFVAWCQPQVWQTSPLRTQLSQV